MAWWSAKSVQLWKPANHVKKRLIRRPDKMRQYRIRQYHHANTRYNPGITECTLAYYSDFHTVLLYHICLNQLSVPTPRFRWRHLVPPQQLHQKVILFSTEVDVFFKPLCCRVGDVIGTAFFKWSSFIILCFLSGRFAAELELWVVILFNVCLRCGNGCTRDQHHYNTAPPMHHPWIIYQYKKLIMTGSIFHT